ncbi:isochorismate synthase [Sporomusa termitida]|uniref:isochorismate synthase n=1 Tax=Sporomusa termitida TaxID=2377 RepID=A0A517DRC3_9FIRM|nr:isochorismate synthase [Sporomusa termitida]QDR79905.1 Isochorismate synthase MenF [Sporomusa termitida]
MQYKAKQIKLDNPLSFWKHFVNEERMLFYNPLKKECILGAKRLKILPRQNGYTDYPYIFSAMTFFGTVKDEKWAGFGNESIAFQYYLVEKDGRQTLHYHGDPIKIENQEMKKYRHAYHYQEDDYEDWSQLFTSLTAAIAAKEVNKVVISREVRIECDRVIHIESVLQNLLQKNQNSNSFIFAYFKDGKTFLGATPEILVQKEQDNILSYALAGTISRDSQNDEVQKAILLRDAKNRYEHQIVIDTIAAGIKKFTGAVQVGDTSVLTLRNVHHLQTPIYAKDQRGTLLEWAARLHPTPALGGNPVHRALALLRRYEKHERGLYAAPLGITDAKGDGVFVAGIRSALIQGNLAFAYTGCGLVAKSESRAEYLETNDKLRTIVESL